MYRKVYLTRSSNAKEKVKYMIWTNEMDRCLSKVLVEHAKKGNKSDNIIKTATYAAAVAVLNENFGLDLTKDHIKNRLKTWRKQYGLLKEILAQKGFKWDRERRMVVADDALWSDYIKVNPDAKHFRAKLIENYDELCIIVGNDQALASCSDNGAEVEVDMLSDNEGVETAVLSEIRSDEKQTKNLRWTEEMDCCLSKILVEQVQKGFKMDNILHREAYNTALAALKEKFGPELSKDHIRNRLRTWKKQYRVLKELLSHTGFKWDETQKMIVGNDSVWNDYIKAHPDARLFRGRVVENLDDLQIIFCNEPAFEISPRNGDTLRSLTPDNEDVEAIDNFQSQVSCTKDQARYMMWTKEMDSCLSNILVKQVKECNKLDSVLKSAIYTDAVTAINEKFQLDLTKDHIKNRLKTWKKQYGILRELLDQDGFKWDERVKMVVADDSTWDDYIKTHHDARPFRGRAVENYDQLSIIFGRNHATGNHSRTADDIVQRLACDVEGMEAIYVSPIRCHGSMKYQAKNIRWSIEMDRCLSKILVEQVILGNKSKLDHKFKPAAYDAAVSALNERFQLDFTKDHVRNRIKTWKKLYVSVKELLDQSDFRWDEKQKMVIADECVWHDYIKINPDVRLLKGRVIENYAELCIIIGNDSPTESSTSDAGAEFDWADDNEGVETEIYENRSDNGKDRGKYVIWTEEMDRCLTEKLLEQVKMGNKLVKNFKPVAYMASLKALNENFRLDLTKENIRSRLKTWKKQYGLVKEVLSHRGFEWDEERKMVVANDEVWVEYIKTHPDAKSLRARSIENYDKLHVIVGNGHANGCCSAVNANLDASPPSNNEEHLETPLRNTMVDEETSQDDSGDATQGSSRRSKGKPSSLSGSKQPSKKRRGNDLMVEIMSSMAANIGRIADALTGSNQSVCLDDLFEMVQNIPGFDDDLIIEACEFLSFDEKRAKMFLKLDERLRKMWLLKRLRGQNS